MENTMKRQGVIELCLLLAVVGAVYAQGGPKEKTSRIVNGYQIPINQAPYAVQLRSRDGYFVCGGALVTTQHVISAAHCVKRTPPKNIIVAAGATRKDERGVERNVIEHYIPADYEPDNQMSNHDIIVFKLDKPMPINENIKTIGFCDTPLTEGQMAQVTGWGAIYARTAYNYDLYTVRVPIVDRDKCAEMYRGFAPIYGSMFCAANLKDGKDACQGDSGSPLVINGKLCGVVSWGRGCAQPDSPGVYTSIRDMLSFINASMH